MDFSLELLPDDRISIKPIVRDSPSVSRLQAENSISNVIASTGREKNYHMISNGEINKMKKQEIQESLRNLRMNDQGNKETISKRLKNFYKNKRMGQKINANNNNKQGGKYRFDKFFDYVCVVDFECTCQAGENVDYPHEIIEFPIVLLKTSTLEVVEEFHYYCRPVINPCLSDFCKNLTGITQEQVDSAPLFEEVLEKVYQWLTERNLGTEFRFAFLTDGPWDMGRFAQMQFMHISRQMPHDLRYWINFRKTFCQVKHIQKASLKQMLALIDLEFVGREHSGLDDARNLARIVIKMMKNGLELRINERLIRRDRLHWVTQRQKEVEDERSRRREASGLPRLPWCKDPEETLNCPEKEKPSLEADQKPKHGGQFYLPYKVVGVSKGEFMMSVYEDCLTCDEDDDENNDSSD